MMRSPTVNSITRRQYWLIIAGITAGLILLCWLAGFYSVEPLPTEDNPATEVNSSDPVSDFLFTPLGNAVVLLILQFIVANLLLWTVIWAWRRLSTRDSSDM